MKLSTKIALNVVLSIIVSVLIIALGTLLYMNYQSKQEAESKFNAVKSDTFLALDSAKSDIKRVSASVASQEKILSSLFLLNLSKDNISQNLALAERKLISQTLKELFSASGLDMLVVYDGSKKPVALHYKNELGIPTNLFLSGKELYTMDEGAPNKSDSAYVKERLLTLPEGEFIVDGANMSFIVNKVVINAPIKGDEDAIGFVLGGQKLVTLINSINASHADSELSFMIESRGELFQNGPKESQINTDDKDYKTVFSIPLDSSKSALFTVVRDRSEISSKIEESQTIFFLIFTSAVLIALPLSYWFAKKEIINPLDRLTSAVTEVKKGGDAKIDIPKNSKEIELLQNAFNDMLLEVKKREEGLKELNKLLEERVKEEVAKARKRDEIIFEQNRTKALAELLMNIAHHWRQPLNSISLGLFNIDDILDYEDGDKDKIKKITALISKELQNISILITDFTKLYSDSDLKDVRIVNIKESLNEALKILGELLRLDNIKVHARIDDALEIKAPKNSLTEVFIALISNVKNIKERRELDECTIDIRSHLDGGSIVIEFSDNAGGIEQEVLPTLFDPYVTTEFKTRNKGLGLFVVKTIIESKLDGEIHASNTHEGAKFLIRLKKEQSIIEEGEDDAISG